MDQETSDRNRKEINLFSNRFIVECFVWAVLVALIVNFLIYSPSDPYGFGTWHSSIIYDLFFLRSGGAFLYGNHEVVELILLFIPFYQRLIKKSKENVIQWTLVVFSTVFLHEIIIQIFSPIVYTWQAVEPQIVSVYMLALGIIFCIALYYCSNFQRRRFVFVATLSALYSFNLMLFYKATNFVPITLARFSPGAQLYNLEANVFEVLGWLILIAVWYLPKSFEEKRREIIENNSIRKKIL